MPSDWASLPARTRWKSGVGTSRSAAPLSEIGDPDQLVRLVAERQPVLRLHRPRLALRVVERPLVERDDPLPGCLDELLAELDRLREDDLLLGRQQGDLADLLEVHPDGIVDPDHVGRDRLEVLRGRLLDLGRVELGRGVERELGVDRLAVGADDLDGDVAVGRCIGRAEVEIVVVVVLVVVDLRQDDLRRPKAAGRELGLLDVGAGAARAGQDGFNELLVERIRHQSPPGVLDGRERG